MTARHPLILAILSAFLLTSVAQAAESVSVLLQKGIYAEETEGNLEAAIKIYEGITKESDANRSLVAQAQYRLGVCELKRVKRDEAEAAFRKIVDQFSDQSELSSKARERLGEMGKSASSVLVRQVWSGENASGDSVSPDGRQLAFIDSETGNLAVRDLATGVTRRLTRDASWQTPGQFAASCAFSPDGKEIVYTWEKYYGRTNWSTGLLIVNLGDGNERMLVPQQANHWLSAEDWSPDGKAIALFDSERDRIRTNWLGTIALVNVADGAIRKIAPQDGDFETLRFSPDGRYLAYSVARKRFGGPPRPRTNDIFVVEVRSGTKKLALEYLSKEQFIGWAPKGSEILFTSERSGVPALWSIGLENGEAKHLPKLLKGDVGGNIHPIGITRDGALFYSSKVTGSTDLYSAAVDFDSGKLLSPPKQITLSSSGGMGSGARNPRPSDDGRLLAFNHGSYPLQKFSIKDLVSGELREYAITNFYDNSWIAFSTNNDYLLIRGITHPNAAGTADESK